MMYNQPHPPPRKITLEQDHRAMKQKWMTTLCHTPYRILACNEICKLVFCPHFGKSVLQRKGHRNLPSELKCYSENNTGCNNALATVSMTHSSFRIMSWTVVTAVFSNNYLVHKNLYVFIIIILTSQTLFQMDLMMLKNYYFNCCPISWMYSIFRKKNKLFMYKKFFFRCHNGDVIKFHSQKHELFYTFFKYPATEFRT